MERGGEGGEKKQKAALSSFLRRGGKEESGGDSAEEEKGRDVAALPYSIEKRGGAVARKKTSISISLGKKEN